MSTTDQNNIIGNGDKRFNQFNKGKAMIVNYHPAKTNNTLLLRLVKSLIDRCANLFYKKGKHMGIGLYNEGVYVDMREAFDLWRGDDYEFPPGIREVDYDRDMRIRYEYAMSEY